MNKFLRITAITVITASVLSLCSCKKADPRTEYPTEDAGGTGYGTAAKSELYIEDFYFLTLGTEKSKVELLTGNAHYYRDNNELLPVYTLNNGDSIAITYEEKNNTATNAVYTYSENQTSESFFNILVDLGVLKSSNQESESEVTVVPGTTTGTDTEAVTVPDTQTGTETETQTPDTQTPDQSGTEQTKPSTSTQTTPGKTTQGAHFASGMYNYTIIEPVLSADMPRDSIIAAIGKPTYYFSHSFSTDSYIIDCYNLNDGSKLYLDYGYERLRLRCAAIYKNGIYTSVLGTPWSAQTKPDGFTRTTIDRKKLNRLSKNMTPAKAYSTLGEPSWYEGTRGSYNDIFMLTDGAQAILNFGSAHNKLTSISIKETDGKITVIDLK